MKYKCLQYYVIKTIYKNNLDRDRERQRQRQTDRERDRQTERDRERDRDRQRQRDRERQRQRHTHTHTYIHTYTHNRIECALPVTTIMALWQLVNVGTRCTVTHCRIALWSHQSAQTASSERCIMQIVNVSERLSTQSIRVLNRIYLEHNI